MKETIFELATQFSAESHGSSDYDKDPVFVMGKDSKEYLPMSFLAKKEKDLGSIESLQSHGFNYSSCDFLDLTEFKEWYSNQFSKKLATKDSKNIGILHYPEQKEIFEAVELVDKCYESLKSNHIIVNGKNFPVQLGEWYSKCIFGLKQNKSTSQRGFDFLTNNDKRVEVKVHWNDRSSPKGVKLKKSLVEMSDYAIIMYIARNLMIRDVLFLDSDFILRKFAGKGHTIFLKDGDVGNYFFSKSSKQYDKVVNKSALLKFSSPNLAMTLAENFESK